MSFPILFGLNTQCELRSPLGRRKRTWSEYSFCFLTLIHREMFYLNKMLGNSAILRRIKKRNVSGKTFWDVVTLSASYIADLKFNSFIFKPRQETRLIWLKKLKIKMVFGNLEDYMLLKTFSAYRRQFAKINHLIDIARRHEKWFCSET